MSPSLAPHVPMQHQGPEDDRIQHDTVTLHRVHSITWPVCLPEAQLWEEASNESRSPSAPIIPSVLGCPACQGTFRTWL